MRYRVQQFVDDVMYLVKLGIIVVVVVGVVLPHVPQIIDYVKQVMNKNKLGGN